MKNFTFKINKATRKIHHTPTSGARLISLDYNYTKQYNYNYDEFYGIHLSSFRGLDFRHKGANLVANTPRNYIQKFKKYISIFSLILPSLALSAGIPVVDITANEQIATQNAKQIAEWAKEATRWTDTVTDFGRAYENIQDFNDKVLSDPEAFIKDKISQTFSKYMIFDKCQPITDKVKKGICLNEMLTAAAEIQRTQDKSNQLNDISKVIQENKNEVKTLKKVKI